MSLQYQDAQGNHYVRGVGQPDFTDAEKQKLGIGKYYGGGGGNTRHTTVGTDHSWMKDLFPESGGKPGEIHHSFPNVMTQGPAGQRQGQRLEQQAPRPEGFQRVATGIADWLTGNNWDFDQRGTGAKFLNEITKVGKDPNGNTFSDHVPNMKPVPPIDPLKVLGQSPTFGGGADIPLTTTDPSIMQGPAPGQGPQGGRYNPFEDQWILDKDGTVVERTPENSVPGP